MSDFQCVSEPPGCWTCQYSSSQKQLVFNQPRLRCIRQIWNTWTILLHTLLAKKQLACPPFSTSNRPNSSWSCCQTVLPQPKRQLSLECFVPHRIKHVSGHWNINAVESNEATRRPFESCLFDPPLFQIIMSDSQMCPSFEMWLMSHLVSEDLGAGIKESAFYWEHGQSVFSVGNGRM